MSDSLGDRIKRYERSYNQTLTPRTPVMIRVDGRAFHTLTRHLQKPFDPRLMSAMVFATIDTAKEMQGFKLGYVQSDEATFLLTDYDQLETQGWFGYELNKVVSLSASLFTAHFNRHFPELWPEFGKIAAFDGRAFNIPAEDAPNAFIWRQRDWERNSLQMLAQHYFSHKALQNKGKREMHEMLHNIEVNWATDLSPRQKNGTWVLRDGTVSSERLTYPEIERLIQTST